MTRPMFRQFCITIPAVVDEDDGTVLVESRNWYGIEEYRKRSWGTTSHPVDGLRTEKKWTDAEFQKQVIAAYTYRIADMHIAEQARQVRETEMFLVKMDRLEAAALAEIDALAKEAQHA